TVCEYGRRFDLEISTDVSATGGRTFDCASFCTRGWCVFACTRSRYFCLVINFCRPDRLVKWLDYMLGCQRLVRCARCLYLAAMGVVGSGTRSGFATNEMAVILAGTVRLSARDGGISVHGLDAAASDRMALYQNNVVPTSRKEPRSLGR